jgi:hypothetical protein
MMQKEKERNFVLRRSAGCSLYEAFGFSFSLIFIDRGLRTKTLHFLSQILNFLFLKIYIFCDQKPGPKSALINKAESETLMKMMDKIRPLDKLSTVT